MKCFHCKQEFSAQHYARVVENRTALYGEWEGWRMSGRFLIAPGKAGRIMPTRLLGLLWQEKAREDLARRKKPAEISGLQNNFLRRSGAVISLHPEDAA